MTVFADESALKSQNCIRVRQYSKIAALDERRLLFFGRGNRYWLNELRHPCVGIGWRSSLSVDSNDATVVCRGDGIVATGKSGNRCTLGRFTLIPADRIEELMRQEDGEATDAK
jgi:hypothetical protein